MSTSSQHLAQVNIGRIVAPLDHPRLAGFVERLADINALADSSPGFVWRLQTEQGDATSLRPYADERILVNLSVWEGLEPLKDFVYRSAHSPVMRRRREWFEAFDGPYLALWWVPAGHRPSVAEARQRLEHLREHGDGPYAFSFKRTFESSEAAAAGP
jgi:hypothetical protein